MAFEDSTVFSCIEFKYAFLVAYWCLSFCLLCQTLLNLLIYQLWVIQQLTPRHLFVHSGFDSKSLKEHFLDIFVCYCPGEFLTDRRHVKKKEEV